MVRFNFRLRTLQLAPIGSPIHHEPKVWRELPVGLLVGGLRVEERMAEGRGMWVADRKAKGKVSLWGEIEAMVVGRGVGLAGIAVAWVGGGSGSVVAARGQEKGLAESN